MVFGVFVGNGWGRSEGQAALVFARRGVGIEGGWASGE